MASSIYRKYHYEIEWEIQDGFDTQIVNAEFCREAVSELDAVTYAIDWMRTKCVNSSNLMYCRVEEVFDSEMRSNVLMWIGEQKGR